MFCYPSVIPLFLQTCFRLARLNYFLRGDSLVNLRSFVFLFFYPSASGVRKMELCFALLAHFLFVYSCSVARSAEYEIKIGATAAASPADDSGY